MGSCWPRIASGAGHRAVPSVSAGGGRRRVGPMGRICRRPVRARNAVANALEAAGRGRGRNSPSQWPLDVSLRSRADRDRGDSLLRPHDPLAPRSRLRWRPAADQGRIPTRSVGMHSRTVLTYALDGQFDKFKSSVGFDDSSAGRGRAVPSAGGRPRVVRRERPSRRPESGRGQRVGASAKQLALEVDFGKPRTSAIASFGPSPACSAPNRNSEQNPALAEQPRTKQ